jgi:PAS domain S-box-containing protein
MLSEILESVDAFIYLKDTQGRYLYANRQVRELFGASTEAILGKSDEAFFDAATAAQIRNNDRQVLEHGKPLRSEETNVNLKNGLAATHLSVKLPLRDEAGEIYALCGISTDITERKRAEQTLRQSEHVYRTMFDSAPEGVWMIGPGRLTTAVNQRLCRLIGYAPEDMLGHRAAEFADVENAKIFQDQARHVPSRQTRTFEVALRHRDGRNIPTEFSSTTLFNDDGSVMAVLAFVVDLSARKQGEAARTALEAQLRESQKMEALGTLAGGVAHDFNNALAAIMGNLELARQDVGPAHPALESLDEIGKAGTRAKSLVQQILTFGRRQIIARKLIFLAPVVEESSRLLRATLPAGMNLKVDCAPSAPAVLADATQIEQVLLNLCTNAWHAVQGQERPGAIEIRLRREQRDGVNFAALTVQDNGRGMDEATRERIFEPFFTTKPVDEGTGLGLAVVHGIVNEHGASIEVHSAPGEGSRFVIYFPEAQVSAQAVLEQNVNARSGIGGGTPIMRGGGKHVLYLDDDESIVFLMTRLLERQGYRVSGHTDARAALAAVRAKPDEFDLAVTDYNMPGMSGLDVALALKAIRADLPVALASGYITEELRAKAPAAGVSELIYKPNAVEDLCETVARLAQTVG